jgi:hypothetical protein
LPPRWGPKIILLGFIRRSIRSDRLILPPHTPYQLPGSNIHPLAAVNREWNKAQPPGTQPLEETLAREELISVKCNIHSWMHSYFVVLKTPHYSVSNENGAFTLQNLPAGKYTLTAWHEVYGKQTQEVIVSGNETQTITFAFKAN